MTRIIYESYEDYDWYIVVEENGIVVEEFIWYFPLYDLKEFYPKAEFVERFTLLKGDET